MGKPGGKGKGKGGKGSGKGKGKGKGKGSNNKQQRFMVDRTCIDDVFKKFGHDPSASSSTDTTVKKTKPKNVNKAMSRRLARRDARKGHKLGRGKKNFKQESDEEQSDSEDDAPMPNIVAPGDASSSEDESYGKGKKGKGKGKGKKRKFEEESESEEEEMSQAELADLEAIKYYESLLGGKTDKLNKQLVEDGFDEDLLSFCDEIEELAKQSKKKRKVEKENKKALQAIDQAEERDAADLEYYKAMLGGDEKKIAKELVADGFDEDLFGFLDELTESVKDAAAGKKISVPRALPGDDSDDQDFAGFNADDDELDMLESMQDFDSDEEDDEVDEELARNTALNAAPLDSEEDDDDEEEDESEQEVSVSEDDEAEVGDDDEEEEISEDEDSEQEEKELKVDPITGEMVSKVSKSEASAGKYVPPHLRKKMEAETTSDGVDEGTKKKLNGLVNRLAEGNLEPISQELARMLTQIGAEQFAPVFGESVLRAACETPNTVVFIMGCYGSLTSLLNLDDPRVGAYVIARAHDIWLQVAPIAFSSDDSTQGKNFTGPSSVWLKDSAQDVASARCVLKNLAMFLALLFVYRGLPVTGLFDTVRAIFDKETEAAEARVDLALTLLRYAGKTLRSAFTSDFKQVLNYLLERCENIKKFVGKEKQGSRLRFLGMELEDLKNNKVSFTVMERLSGVQSWIDTSGLWKRHREQDRIPCSMPTTNSCGEPFVFLQTADLDEKWWFAPTGKALPTARNSNSKESKAAIAGVTDQTRVVAAAEAQRMNTDVRKALFAALMGAEDPTHACDRIMSLTATSSHGRGSGAKTMAEDALFVILHCALREEKYNPFYGVVATLLCEAPGSQSKRYVRAAKHAVVHHMALCHSYKLRSLMSFAKFVMHLVLAGHVSLASWRFLDFSAAQASSKSAAGPLSGKLGLFLALCLEIILEKKSSEEEIDLAVADLRGYEDVKEGALLVIDTLLTKRLEDRDVPIPDVEERLEALRAALN